MIIGGLFCLSFLSTNRAIAPGRYEQFYVNAKKLTKHVSNPKKQVLRMLSDQTGPVITSAAPYMHCVYCNHRCSCQWSLFLLLSNLLRIAPWILKSIILVSSSLLPSLLPMSMLDGLIFSGRPPTRIFSLLFNQYFVVILVESADARCAVVGAVFIDSI